MQKRDEKLRKERNCHLDFRNPALYRPYYNRTDWTGITWPAKLEDLDTLEKNNPKLAINVLMMEADTKDEIRRKDRRNRRKIPEEMLEVCTEDGEEEKKKKTKFKAVNNIHTIRTSNENNREKQINLLLIHKVYLLF